MELPALIPGSRVATLGQGPAQLMHGVSESESRGEQLHPERALNSLAGADYLRTVIDSFADFDFENPCDLILEQFRSPAIVFSRQYWQTIRTQFTSSETIILAKALTVMERKFKWIGGAGAAAIWIVKDLLDQQPEVGKALAEWMVHRTDNGYLRLACDRRPALRVWVGDLMAKSPVASFQLDEIFLPH